MRRLLLGLVVVASLLSLGNGFTSIAQAQNEQVNPLIIECDRVVLKLDGTVDEAATNRCSVETFVAQFVRLAQWGLTIVVFLAVLMFVYGGFEFITAGGRQAKISSGQNIISGTVIGLLISMSAYVIINFSVGAITGTKTSTNPFTAIATVFDNPKNKDINDLQNIIKPFSGLDDQKSTPQCRTTWNTACNSEIYCADEAQLGLSGPVASYQSRLKSLGCCTGTIDGCYGKSTTQCVRRFQIANNVFPTGTIDAKTKAAMEQANAQRCDDAANQVKINTALNAVPATVLPDSSISTDSGCCVVRKNVGETPTPLYCINELSERACAALGPNYVFAKGEQCSRADSTKTLCGLCRSVDNFCFQEAGRYWCENVVQDPESGLPHTFENRTCIGGGVCNECLEQLKTQR